MNHNHNILVLGLPAYHKIYSLVDNMKDQPPKAPSFLQGEDIRQMLILGRQALQINAGAINSVNIFPVPDGDTGTNLVLTMMSVEEEAAKAANGTTSEIMHAIAKGSLLGARGNSGVILAQILQGFTRVLSDKDYIHCEDLAMALAEASKEAYKAVGNPVEGTMLTIIREIADTALQKASSSESITQFWEHISRSANDAVARTPDLMPALRQAGVVDAGGLGLAILIEGALNKLKGKELNNEELSSIKLNSTGTTIQNVNSDFISTTKDDLYGYCTQLLIHGENLDTETVRSNLRNIANSTVVVGSDILIKIHAHTMDPGPILSYAITLGTIDQIDISNMDEQHKEFISSNHTQKEHRPVGLLAIASGEGIVNVFLDIGVSTVLAGGDTMNPSIREILDAIDGINADMVIILPNNNNIIPAAKQAASMASRTTTVIPTHSIPHGIAAALAFNPSVDYNDNIASMEKTIPLIISASVCVSARSTKVHGVSVAKGQFIGLIDKEILAYGNEPNSVLLSLIEAINPESGALVSLYWGDETTNRDAEEAIDRLTGFFPTVDFEVIEGGQPYYNYIVSVE
jgi:DAK2 domain fusion protein YloV